jgi:hypothetical protein
MTRRRPRLAHARVSADSVAAPPPPAPLWSALVANEPDCHQHVCIPSSRAKTSSATGRGHEHGRYSRGCRASGGRAARPPSDSAWRWRRRSQLRPSRRRPSRARVYQALCRSGCCDVEGWSALPAQAAGVNARVEFRGLGAAPHNLQVPVQMAARNVYARFLAFQISSQGHCRAHSRVTNGKLVTDPSGGRTSINSSTTKPQRLRTAIISPCGR